MRARRAVDATPYSAFVREMRAVFREREQARTLKEKLDLEKKGVAIMRKHLGVDAANVPRDTSSDQRCHAQRVQENHPENVPDRKLASVGPEAD